MVAYYDMGEGVKRKRLVENSQLYNDGQYHVVRFIREGPSATLWVDNYPEQALQVTGQLYNEGY